MRSQRVKRLELADGDVIQLGEHKLLYRDLRHEHTSNLQMEDAEDDELDDESLEDTDDESIEDDSEDELDDLAEEEEAVGGRDRG